MKNRVKLVWHFTIVVLLLLLSSRPVLAGPSDEVRVAYQYEPATVNMLELKRYIGIPIILTMHERLLASDPVTGERTIKDSLSESVEVLDGKDIKFKLRKNARFHTGDPVTAHDVKFTFEEMVNPKNANVVAGPLDEIEEIEVVDDYTVIFRLYEPYAAWKELFWVGICSKEYFKKVGWKKFRSHPVGSGAFKFVEWKKGQYIQLEAVPNHPIFNVDFKTLKLMIIPDETTRLAMLETGEIDLMTDVLPINVRRLKSRKGIVVKKEAKAPSLFAIAFRADTYPILKDSNIGKAINHGINRQEIIDKVFLGEGYPLYMNASKPELGWEPTVYFEFNPEKARAFLKKSSYKPGTPLILSYSSSVPMAAMISAIVQRYLKNVGITVKLQQLEAGTQLTYAINKDPREGHLSLFTWPGGRDPSTRILLTIPSTAAMCRYTDRPKQKELDRLANAQSQELDVGKRKVLLKEMHQILTEDAWIAVLFGLNMIYAMNDRIDYTWAAGDSHAYGLERIKIRR